MVYLQVLWNRVGGLFIHVHERMVDMMTVFFFVPDRRMDEDFWSTHGVCILLQDFAEGTEPGEATVFLVGFRR